MMRCDLRAQDPDANLQRPIGHEILTAAELVRFRCTRHHVTRHAADSVLLGIQRVQSNQLHDNSASNDHE